VQLVAQFSVARHYPDLLRLAQEKADQQLGVNALSALLDKNQGPLLLKALAGSDDKAARATLQAISTAADDRAVAPLLALVSDENKDVELRRLAVRALARSRNGARALVHMARDNKLNSDLKQAAGAALAAASWRDVKDEAARLFPLPPAKDNHPLPPFGDLVRMRGDARRGKNIFNTTGTCATCHTVNGIGKDVGPNLSEIGKKLSREALLESILYPSAGIAQNYETYVVALKNGGTVTGLLASQTAEAVSIKGADAIVRTFPRSDIEEMAKSPLSLMPADLQKLLTTQDLADVVDYLLTLRGKE
jgi:putative heme-binding domain-containing protein